MYRKIILFELNEVPYRIIDSFCRWRPESHLARQLREADQYVTVSEDKSHLSPWLTWPTVHRGVVDAQHEILNFGQDLSGVDREFPPIWQLLASQGVRVGMCGSLHSYPLPADLNSYAFYLPDTFAAGSECFPQQLSTFQEFNLAAARGSSRNVSRKLPWSGALKVLAGAPSLGLRARTFASVGKQLISEQVQRARKVRRRTYQSVLAFDVFFKQLTKTKPDFATFFTNHVASTLHRFWAAQFPDDYQEFGFDPEWVNIYAGEIEFTMGWADQFLGRLLKFVQRQPEYQLWITSSMGQAATEAKSINTQLYIVDHSRFMQAMGLQPSDWEERPAMAPRYSFFVAPEHVEGFRKNLDAIQIAGSPLEYKQAEQGFFNLRIMHFDPTDTCVQFQGRTVSLQDLGMAGVPIEDHTCTNAYHIPQGCLMIHDPQRRNAEVQRTEVSTCDIAPAILRNFGLAVPEYMNRPGAIGVGGGTISVPRDRRAA